MQRNANTELRRALKAAVRLQADYAQLLNQYDGGDRAVIRDVDEWLAKVRDVDERVRVARRLGQVGQKVVEIAESLEEELVSQPVNEALELTGDEVQP
jgi:hypothetical protein